MKKVILMVAVAFMTAMNVNAQNEDLRHELSLSYGFGSIAQFGDGIGEGIGLVFSNKEYLSPQQSPCGCRWIVLLF